MFPTRRSAPGRRVAGSDLEPGAYFASVGDSQTQGINTRDVAVTNVIELGTP